MPKNRIHKYNPGLKVLARQLRQDSTLAEVILWLNLKKKTLSYEFHRQVPIDEYIVDFYCHELELAIEIDGYTHDYNYDKDDKRQKVLEGLGIRVVRITEEDVKKHLNDVIRILLAAIEEIESGKITTG